MNISSVNFEGVLMLGASEFSCKLISRYLGGGGGGRALTMTMTPWNLPHGQWSKKLTMTMTPSILPMVNGQNYQF